MYRFILGDDGGHLVACIDRSTLSINVVVRSADRVVADTHPAPQTIDQNELIETLGRINSRHAPTDAVSCSRAFVGHTRSRSTTYTILQSGFPPAPAGMT